MSTKNTTHTVTTAEQFRALNLSFYTQSKLADCMMVVYPEHCIARDVASGKFKGELTLDELGNFVSFN